MHYRIATSEDLTQLAQLRWEFRAEDGDEQPVVSYYHFIQACVPVLQRAMESGQATYWLAEMNGEIVAHIFVQRIDLVPRPCKLKDQFGYITNNYTKPAFRNQGIGSELLKRVIAWAKDEDYELLIVYPSEQAVPYYRRAGFTTETEVMELTLRAYI